MLRKTYCEELSRTGAVKGVGIEIMSLSIGASPTARQRPKEVGGALYLVNPIIGDFSSENFFQKVLRVSCRNCEVTFENIESWKIHQITVHNDTVAYGKKNEFTIWEKWKCTPGGAHACGGCGLRFSQSRQQRRHERLETFRIMLVCTVCNLLCEDIEKHIKLYHSELHICGQCGVNIVNDPVAHYDDVHGGFHGVLQLVDILCARDGLGYFVHESALSLIRKFSGKRASVRGHASTIGESSSLVETLRLRCFPRITVPAASYLRVINFFPATLFSRIKIINSRRPPAFRCRICGYVAQNLHKTREMMDHSIDEHFNQILNAKILGTSPYTCPHNGCMFTGRKQQIKRHYLSMHISHELLFE